MCTYEIASFFTLSFYLVASKMSSNRNIERRQTAIITTDEHSAKESSKEVSSKWMIGEVFAVQYEKKPVNYIAYYSITTLYWFVHLACLWKRASWKYWSVQLLSILQHILQCPCRICFCWWFLFLIWFESRKKKDERTSFNLSNEINNKKRQQQKRSRKKSWYRMIAWVSQFSLKESEIIHLHSRPDHLIFMA